MSGFPMSGSCSKEPMEYCGEAGAAAAAVVASASELVPLDFTYVVYDAAHPHSQLLAYLTFLPILVGLSLLNAVFLRRDLEAAYHALGLLLSSAINHVLKRLIQQPRPIGSAKLGHGMPSDHAQFSFFFIVYFSFWLVHRARLSRRERVFWITALVLLGVVVGWSRIHLGVHTEAQVLVGGAIGCVLGCLWGLWARVCVWSHIFPLLERSPLGRRWYLKDCHNLPPGVRTAHEFEYIMYTTTPKHPEASGTSSPASPASPNGVVPLQCPYAAKKQS